MLSVDEKILLLFGLVPPESKSWLVAKLKALVQIGSAIDSDVKLDDDTEDHHLLFLIGLLTEESKIWITGKLLEFIQIKNTDDIVSVLGGALKEPVALHLH